MKKLDFTSQNVINSFIMNPRHIGHRMYRRPSWNYYRLISLTFISGGIVSERLECEVLQ